MIYQLNISRALASLCSKVEAVEQGMSIEHQCSAPDKQSLVTKQKGTPLKAF